MLSLALRNTSNHCYANATVYALAWSALARDTLQVMLAGNLRSCVVKALSCQQPVTLWQMVPWQMTVLGWQAPHIQHDVAEFLSFLQARTHLPCMQGKWEARLGVDNEAVVQDSGQVAPLFLPAELAPEQEATLQSLINEWSAQVYTHALTEPPDLLVLQLNRFQPRGGEVHKSLTPVRLLLLRFLALILTL